jgi:hypothetical protein
MTAEGKQTFSFRGGDLKKGKYMRITREIALGGMAHVSLSRSLSHR